LAALSELGVKPTKFPFSEYPPHLNIDVNAGEYAWKPAIIWRELEARHRSVCWMDAGNRLRMPIARVRLDLLTHGFYSTESSGTVKDWTHPGLFDALGLPRSFAGLNANLNGSCIAFNWRHERARALAKEWYECAMQKDIIAPAGSSRENHRQDQALLTVLAYRSGIISAPRPISREFRIHQDLPEDAAT
jgi:hypothetical protein